MSIASLVTLASCGSSDDGTSTDATADTDPTTTQSSATPDDAAASASGGDEASSDEASSGALPNACDVIILQDWETITALDLAVPEQDTGLLPDGGSVCGVAAEGTSLPYLFTVAIGPLDTPGSVANLASFLDVYDGMEQIDGIGDRALYWDEATTYEGDAVTDRPILAFEDGTTNVTITLSADGLGRVELEQLGMALADQV